jgi:hypothetical protein
MRLIISGVAVLMFVSCDSEIRPPSDVAEGAIRGIITYQSAWPPPEEIRDLRFVAMRFVPADTADFLQLNRLEFSDRLEYYVNTETIIVSDVPAGTYPFAVVARQRTSDALSWQALGIYEENEGVFIVARDETVDVAISVDFDNLPDFP